MCGECNWKIDAQKTVRANILLANGMTIEATITKIQYDDLVLAEEAQSDERVTVGEIEISGKNIRKIWRSL